MCEKFFGKGRWDGVVSFSNSATFVHDPGKQKQLLIEAHMDPSNDGCGRRAEPPIWHGRRAKPLICRGRRAEEVPNTRWKTDGFPYLPWKTLDYGKESKLCIVNRPSAMQAGPNPLSVMQDVWKPCARQRASQTETPIYHARRWIIFRKKKV